MEPNGVVGTFLENSEWISYSNVFFLKFGVALYSEAMSSSAVFLYSHISYNPMNTRNEAS